MTKKIKLDDKEYPLDGLSEEGKAKLILLQFSVKKEEELSNMLALLQRAKNSYIESLNKEMLSKKAGFLLDDD